MTSGTGGTSGSGDDSGLQSRQSLQSLQSSSLPESAAGRQRGVVFNAEEQRRGEAESGAEEINSDGCQKGLRYRFAHASHHTAATIENSS